MDCKRRWEVMQIWRTLEVARHFRMIRLPGIDVKVFLDEKN